MDGGVGSAQLAFQFGTPLTRRSGSWARPAGSLKGDNTFVGKIKFYGNVCASALGNMTLRLNNTSEGTGQWEDEASHNAVQLGGFQRNT